MTAPPRSVIWQASRGKAVVKNGQRLTLLLQAWDTVDEPLALELYEHDPFDAANERPIGWLPGRIQRQGSGKKERLWFAPDDPAQPFVAAVGPDAGTTVASFAVRLPAERAKKFLTVPVEVRDGPGEGRFEIGVRVLAADRATRLSPADDEHHVLAYVLRDLDEPAVLDRFTPYVSQVAGKNATAANRQAYFDRFVTSDAPVDWDDVPRTPIGEEDWPDIDESGCGHICVARALAFWGEFDDPEEFIARAGLSDSVVPGKSKDGTPKDPRPVRAARPGGASPWTADEIASYPHAGVRAVLLWLWWWRQFKLFGPSPPKRRSMTGDFVDAGLAKFPRPSYDAEAPITYSVERPHRTLWSLWRYLAGAIPPKGHDPGTWHHPVPVLLLLTNPGHWVLGVGYQETKAGPRLIVHDSGNVLKPAKKFAGGHPAGYESFPNTLHFMTEAEIKAHATNLYTLRRLAPPASVPTH